eukprot:4912850-Pyramimonas_sp.AAC.1
MSLSCVPLAGGGIPVGFKGGGGGACADAWRLRGSAGGTNQWAPASGTSGGAEGAAARAHSGQWV